MRWTNNFVYTLRDKPSDAEITSHQLLVRGGYIKKVGQGVYVYGPLALRSIRKLEAIIREELEKVNAIEVLMPMAQPKELWSETGRWDEMGKGLLKFKNRLDQDWCLGATHEEVITDFVRNGLKSYKDLPKNIYQIQTKYRDEVRPRFGLLRCREFIMKDAYTFDQTKEDALSSYNKMFEAYKKIFSRLDVEFRVVKADSGNIGGDQSQEFHILAGSGEDELLVSKTSDFAANVEICPAIDSDIKKDTSNKLPKEEFATPGARTIDDLSKLTSVPANQLVKTMFFSYSEEKYKPMAVLLRGSDEVNPIKLKNSIGLDAEPPMLTDTQVKELTGASPGSCGPVGLEIPVYIDKGVEPLVNYIVGANKDDMHIKNVNHERDFKVNAIYDLRKAKAGDKDPESDGVLESVRGIEVGHIFYLGTKYSKKMKAKYLDSNGRSNNLEMGCYGIGVSRTVQAVIEQCNDEAGIVWPKSIAPYDVHICLLDPGDKEAEDLVSNIEAGLKKQGKECFIDDRKERPGVKFKDADLLGMPLRVTIGARGLKEGNVELVERKSLEKQSVPITEIVEKLVGLLS